MIIREKILHHMEDDSICENFHLKFSGVHTFWMWVVMPKHYGGRLGFVNWVKWRFFYE